MPTTTMVVDLTEADGGGTHVEITSTFPSLEEMEQLTAMGMDEGIRAAVGQMDDTLREDAASR